MALMIIEIANATIATLFLRGGWVRQGMVDEYGNGIQPCAWSGGLGGVAITSWQTSTLSREAAPAIERSLSATWPTWGRSAENLSSRE